MKPFRKVCIAIILVLYLCGIFPPLMQVYNRPGFIFGIPTFIFGLMALSLGMVLVIYILYRHEERDNGPDDPPQ